MKNCTELESMALDYLDGALAGAERASFEAHLASCVDCATRLRDFSVSFSTVHQMLDSWDAPAASRNFDRQMLDRIAAESTAASGLWSGVIAPFFSSLLRPAFAGTLSAVFLVAFAVVRYYPGASGGLAGMGAPVPNGLESGDEVALVQDLADLDDMDLLSNFEVLQEMKGPTP